MSTLVILNIWMLSQARHSIWLNWELPHLVQNSKSLRPWSIFADCRAEGDEVWQTRLLKVRWKKVDKLDFSVKVEAVQEKWIAAFKVST